MTPLICYHGSRCLHPLGLHNLLFYSQSTFTFSFQNGIEVSHFILVFVLFFFRDRYAAEMVSPYVTAQCSHPRSNSPRSAPTFPWGGCNPCLTAPWRYCEPPRTVGCWSVECALFSLVLWIVHIKNITGVRA